MIGKIISSVVHERILVLVLVLALIIGGFFAFRNLNIEAYPDPAPPTIDIITQNPGSSAEEMERQITLPLETALNGMPGVADIRSVSLFGLSDIKCYFNFDTDYRMDRQEVLNRIQAVSLPQNIQPQLSPESAVGEIYRYQLVGENKSLMDLKVLEDWVVERNFKQVPGVIDVVSFGGPTKEFHVDLDPTKLINYGVSVSQVMTAIANSNINVGANYLELGEQSYNVRGIGLFKNEDDIGNVTIAAKGGTPLYLKQLGTVSVGEKIRLGKVGKDNDPDIVQGIVLMRPGEKSLPTLKKVEEKVKQLNQTILPSGVKIVPYYDRTDLINLTTETVTRTLVEGMILVAFILFAFLGDLRASLIVALTIPLALLITLIIMVLRGDSANLISMGAIDFGIIVDASVVMVENIYRFFSEPRAEFERREKTIIDAASEVAKPIFFSTAIIVTAFLPLFTMRGVEGKIFGPMALTYGFALAGALLVALTFAPVMCSFLFRPMQGERETFVTRGIRAAYAPLLRMTLDRPVFTIGAAALLLAFTLALIPRLGGEFMPKLEEGNLWVRATMPNTISFSYASGLADRMREVFKKQPEVSTVVSQLGRPDDGTDATSFFNCEFFVNLKPTDQWRRSVDKPELVRQIEDELRKEFPSVTFNFSQNIQDNVEEAMSGVKGENSLKLFGDDLAQLEKTAGQIYSQMKTVRGIHDLGIFTELGQPNLLIQVDRARAARYGLNTNDVNGTVQAAVGGQAVTQVLDGERRFDVVVRFLPGFRQNTDVIGNTPVSTSTGSTIPLRDVANITTQSGASFIYRENNSRYIPIKFSVRGRDLQSTIDEAEGKIKKEVRLPEGYHYEWSGEFQELQDAVDRLKVIVPISFMIIFALLYLHFRSFADAMLVLGAVPLALVGGLLSLYVTNTNFSISASVGFISLFGVAVLDGVILISYIKQLRSNGVPLLNAVIDGSGLRLRPVLMTALAAAIGLLPAALATGIGSETQRPLARVVVGGMITAPILILFVLPALYLFIHRMLDRSYNSE